MAPKRRGDAASSKAKKGEASQKQSAAKKSKRESPAGPTTVYAVVKSEGYGYDGFHCPGPATISVEGVYPSEGQAYAAAIWKLIAGLELIQSGKLPDLRDIATAKEWSLKQRLEEIEEIAREVYGGGGEVVEFCVKRTEMFPLETAKDDKLLGGLMAEVSANAELEESENLDCSSSDSGGSVEDRIGHGKRL